MRLELEFEHFDDEKQDVMDVEEVKRKDAKLRRGFDRSKDESYTSAHIKAARKILAALKKFKFRMDLDRRINVRRRESVATASRASILEEPQDEWLGDIKLNPLFQPGSE